MRSDFRRFGKDSHVGVSDPQFACAEHAENVMHESLAISALPAWIGVFEVLTDIAKAGGAQQRVAERVEHHVAIRVCHDAACMRYAHTAEHDELARTKRMDINALPDSHDKR